MPGTSNVRDDESDHESISELLSPSDGYFTEGHTHPGDVLVPDPSQGSSQLDKEREAREETHASTSGVSTPMPARIDTTTPIISNARPTSSSRPLSPTTTSPVIATERTPLISSAPPAYSPPEPGSPYHQHARSVSTAGLYETMGRQEPFFPNETSDLGRDTESLLPDNKKRWPSRLNKWWDNKGQKMFKFFLLVLGVIFALAFLSSILDVIADGDRGHRDSDHDLDNGRGIPSSCKIKDRSHIDFTWEKPSSFSFVHLPKPADTRPRYAHVQNLGTIHIRTVPKETKEAVKVDMDFLYSSDAIAAEIEFSKQDRVFTVYTASTIPYWSLNTARPCLWLNITISLREDVELEKFTIDTTSLTVIFDKDHTAPAREIIVESVAGGVFSMADDSRSANWGGREITIITDAGSINGAYPLFDKLHLETRAGSINTDLTLHPDRYNRVNDALLFLKTVAGSITARTPVLRAIEEGRGNYSIDDIPQRNYLSDISLNSGSAQLQLVHGRRTTIYSSAGSVHAELTPWLEPRKESRIDVKSSVGSVDLTVRDAIAFMGEPLRHLYSEYAYSTGTLTLRYPDEWEGRVVGKIVTGNINIEWPGLEVNRRDRDGLYSRLEASKGKGDALLNFSGGSGSANLWGKGGNKYQKTA